MENSPKQILVTGGAGFIGTHLTERLLATGHSQITILDNLLPQVHGDNPRLPAFLHNGQVRFFKNNICDKEAMRAALKDAEVVVHLAADTGTGQSMYQMERYSKVNVMGTALLCDLLVNEPHGVKKIILASSRAVYGEGKYLDANGNPVYPSLRRATPDASFDPINPATGQADLRPAPTDENARTLPVSVYGTSKLAQEQLLMQTADLLGIDMVAFRIQNAYGPGQSLKNPYTGILPLFARLAMSGLPIPVFEDGQESRDFIHVNDVVGAMCKYLSSGLEGRHVINLGTGRATTLLQLAEMIKQTCNSHSDIHITGQMRKGDIRHNFADISRLRSALGFTPAVPLEEGLSQFIDWRKRKPLNGELAGVAEAMQELKVRKMLV